MRRVALVMPLLMVLGCSLRVAVGPVPKAAPRASVATAVPTVRPAPTHRVGSAYPVNLAGDVSGPPGATVVGKVQGQAVSSSTPTSAYPLVWSGTSWGAAQLNLAGAGVTGTLPVGNLPNLAGDVTGAITSNAVTTLTGSSGTVTSNAATITWGSGVTSPTISQAGTGTANGTAQSITIAPQAANATGNSSSGSVFINPGAPSGSGAYGSLNVGGGGVVGVQLGLYGVASGGGTSYGAAWFGGVTPSQTNFGVLGNGSFTYLNVPTGGQVSMSIGGSSGTGIDVTPNGAQLFGPLAFGGGTKVLGIANASVAPTSGCTGGVCEYASGGALWNDSANHLLWGLAPDVGGTHGTQDNIVLPDAFDFTTTNTSFGPYNAQTYTIGGGHHAVRVDCTILGRVVTPGSGGTFWTAAADSSYACEVIATGWYTGSAWTSFSGLTYPQCDCSGGSCTSPTSPTNPLFVFSATQSGGTYQIQWSLYNDGSTTKPVVDAMSTCRIIDN